MRCATPSISPASPRRVRRARSAAPSFWAAATAAMSGSPDGSTHSGARLHVGGAHVDTSAPHGAFGNWLLDPTDFTIAASGGDITGAQLSANLATTDVTIQSSQGAAGARGDVNVLDAVTWSSATK